MDEAILEKARRAMLAGDRSEVTDLLDPYEYVDHTEVQWLLASAAEDESQRNQYLQAVIDAGEEPYAAMAQGILQREAEIRTEMMRAPRWQQFLVAHRKSIIAVVGVGAIAVAVWMISSVFNNSNQQQLNATATAQALSFNATQTATHLPPTAMATLTFRYGAAGVGVQYPPFGSMRVLTLEYPAQRTVLQALNGTPQEPPVNSSFAAILYEFTCGSVQNAFCTRPPEASIALQLSNGQRVPQAQLTVHDPYVPTPGILPTGSVTRAWFVFPVPNGQLPSALIILADTDPGTSEMEEFTISLMN